VRPTCRRPGRPGSAGTRGSRPAVTAIKCGKLVVFARCATGGVPTGSYPVPDVEPPNAFLAAQRVQIAGDDTVNTIIHMLR
jgi:hypothetical protein